MQRYRFFIFAGKVTRMFLYFPPVCVYNKVRRKQDLLCYQKVMEILLKQEVMV